MRDQTPPGCGVSYRYIAQVNRNYEEAQVFAGPRSRRRWSARIRGSQGSISSARRTIASRAPTTGSTWR